MNKTYFVIQAQDMLHVAKLQLIRTWLRRYFMEHSSETSLTIKHDFYDFVAEMCRKDFYEIFREPELYKFVYLDNSDEQGEELPRFSMHKRMYSTYIQPPKKLSNSK